VCIRICVQLYSQLVYIQHTQVFYSIIKSLVLQLKINNRNKEQFNNPFPTTFYREVRTKEVYVIDFVFSYYKDYFNYYDDQTKRKFAVKYSNMNHDLFMNLQGTFRNRNARSSLSTIFRFYLVPNVPMYKMIVRYQ